MSEIFSSKAITAGCTAQIRGALNELNPDSAAFHPDAVSRLAVKDNGISLYGASSGCLSLLSGKLTADVLRLEEIADAFEAADKAAFGEVPQDGNG